MVFRVRRVVGVLGTFPTGSATAPNILCTDLQDKTVPGLRTVVLPLIGMEEFGAAGGKAICPHNIIATAAAVGLGARREGC